MASDLRINLGLLDHPKTRKLIRRLGPAALEALLHLWIYVALNRPEGRLTAMSAEDVELAAHWPERRAGEFIKAVLEVRFVDQDGETFVIHDWRDHQPFLADSKARSETARRSAQARWNAPYMQPASDPDAKRIPAAPEPHADGNALISSSPNGSDPPKEGAGAKAPRPTRRKPETPLPEGWALTPELVDYARKQDRDPELEAERFKEHAVQKDVRNRDWNAAFRMWCLSSYGRSNGNGPAPAANDRAGSFFDTIRDVREEATGPQRQIGEANGPR